MLWRMPPMSILVDCDIFQVAMGTLFQYLEHLIVNLDDLITIGSGTLEEHLAEVNELLFRLLVKGLQVNFFKTAWAVQEVEYLGFVINRNGIKLQPNNLQAITDIITPTTQKKLCWFLGMIIFYKNIRPKRSITLAPLTTITEKSKGYPFDITNEFQNAFEGMKGIMIKDPLIAYPQYSKSLTYTPTPSIIKSGE